MRDRANGVVPLHYRLIGIGFCTKNFPLTRLPGWEPESWGYHGDDGRAFCCQGIGKTYGPMFNTGDVIGCGVNFRTHTAFFTRNGNELGTIEASLSNPLSNQPLWITRNIRWGF